MYKVIGRYYVRLKDNKIIKLYRFLVCVFYLGGVDDVEILWYVCFILGYFNMRGNLL